MLLGGFVSPCGALSMCPEHKDPGEPDRILSQKLLLSRQQIAKEIENLTPDVVILLGVHELADPGNRFNIFVNKKGEANTNYMPGCECHACTTVLNVNLDDKFATELLCYLRANDQNVTGDKFTDGVDDSTALLRWSTAIPLSKFEHLDKLKFVVISMPQFLTLRHNYQEVLTNFGRTTAEFISKSGKKVVVVACGDLHHGFTKEGPYGIVEIAEKFDTLCGNWASSLCKASMDEAAKFWPGKARSCAFPGLIVLDSILRTTANPIPVETVYDAKLHVIGHPSYFGMMVSSYLLKK